MPADPKMDEDRLLRLLTDPSAFLSSNGLRQLMSLVLLACYDRKVEREFMAEMLDATAGVGITLSQMEGAAKVRATLGILRPQLPTPEIEAQLATLCQTLNRQKGRVAHKFSLVAQMPTSLDTIS